MAYHVSKARFAELVEQAMAELPDPFAGVMEEVRVEIEDRPSPKLLQQLEMDEDELLLGLYHGRSLLERSVEDSGRMPDVITIFQDDVEEVSDSEADLVREVRTTVLHEIGHFFGMNEADLDNLGYG
jgi:predicted Zn-dependent protease with MMP-like domain